jgi:hypothetical protein
MRRLGSRARPPHPAGMPGLLSRTSPASGFRLPGRAVRLVAAVATAGAGLVLSPTVASATNATTATGWIRFAHFATGDGAVRVTVDGSSLGDDIAYRDVTNFMVVPGGPQSVVVMSVRPASSSPLATAQVTVPAGGAVTVAALAALPATAKTTKASASSGTGHESVPIRLQSYTDDLAQPAAGHSIVRIIDTFVGSPALTAQLAQVNTSSVLKIGPIPYGQASSYATVPIGKYNVVIKDGKPTPLVTGNNWPVPPGTVSSVVVIAAPEAPTLEVLVDAVGTATAPKGGMQTGFGGTAPRPLPVVRTVGMPVVAATIVFGGGFYIVSRRRRSPANRPQR